MRCVIALLLIVSVIVAPFTTLMAAMPKGVPQNEDGSQCGCCEIDDSLRQCCCGRDDVATPGDVSCCQIAEEPTTVEFGSDCPCPNCPCSQSSSPVHYWTGNNSSFAAPLLETRLTPRNDLLHSIRWEPSAPVPEAGV